MNLQPIPSGRRPWQFSLGSLLIAVVFVAIACAAAKCFMMAIQLRNLPLDSPIPFLALLTIPVSLCGAIGILLAHLKAWLAYGVVFDLMLIGIAMLTFPAVHP